MTNLVKATNLIQRQTYDTALLSNSLQNALANPPYSIRDKFETACFIKFLCGFDEADVTLVDQVGKRQSLMLILLGNGYYKSQVGSYQLVLSALAFRTALANLLSKLNFLVNANQWCTANFYQILVQCLTRAIRNTLLNL